MNAAMGDDAILLVIWFVLSSSIAYVEFSGSCLEDIPQENVRNKKNHPKILARWPGEEYIDGYSVCVPCGCSTLALPACVHSDTAPADQVGGLRCHRGTRG